MDSAAIRQKFLNFFEKKGHKIVPSSSLVPENDPSVLFTTAGMQQFKPYYTGQKNAEKDFGLKNTASVQKCVRTSDIDEVGDNTHLTFFEMLGNFSFGGYFKEEAIKLAHEFITREMNLPISYVTIFEGKGAVPRDEESKKIWKSLGVPDDKILEQGMEDVFWGPTGNSGPCGPTTEIYCQNAAGEDVEIWNIVFNEYFCHGNREALLKSEAKLEPLETKGIDTGMGFERLLTTIQQKESVFETDLFAGIMTELKREASEWDEKSARIFADHIRTAIFMIADGVLPSNMERGYILRRLIRRAVLKGKKLGFGEHVIGGVVATFSTNYGLIYPELQKFQPLKVLKEEENRFRETIDLGLGELNKWYRGPVSGVDINDEELHKILEGQPKVMPGAIAFRLFTTYGFPIELTREILKEREMVLNEKQFDEAMQKHQAISRAGSEKKFKGGLADASDAKVVQYHTATHLLHQALHDVLGENVAQKGSNITAERLRFDFSHSAKMTDEEKRKVEEIVNQKIKEHLPVQNIVLPKSEAEKIGARMFFGEKYGEQVSVYFIGDSLENAYSKEFCGGPHVQNTSELKGVFKILKEEAVAAGVRRIKAVLG